MTADPERFVPEGELFAFVESHFAWADMETALQLALREGVTSAGLALVRLYDGPYGEGEHAQARWLSSLMIAPGRSLPYARGMKHS